MNIVCNDNVNIIINTVLGSEKDFLAALLLFSSEVGYFDILSYLRSQNGVTRMIPNFEIIPLLFNRTVKKN